MIDGVCTLAHPGTSPCHHHAIGSVAHRRSDRRGRGCSPESSHWSGDL